jgi:hypothetical protein
MTNRFILQPSVILFDQFFVFVPTLFNIVLEIKIIKVFIYKNSK